MKEILIIGAGGYVGSRLSYLLAKLGYKVTAICYPEIPHNTDWISLMKEVILGDITKPDTINEITDRRFDSAIYLVSLDHNDSNKEPDFVCSINVMPVWNILEKFKQKHNLKQFIYFSTIHVYGKLPLEVVDESLLPKPLNPYGLTHLLAEEVCNMYNENSMINCVNLRLSNSYGSPFCKENNCWWLVVNDLCRTAFYKKKIILKSDGNAMRDFIHYQDIFNAINKLIEVNSNRKLDSVYHLTSGITHSIRNLAEKVRKEYFERYGCKLPIELPKGVRLAPKINKKQFTISNKNLKGLGFMPTIGIKQGINELFDYFEQNEK